MRDAKILYYYRLNHLYMQSKKSIFTSAIIGLMMLAAFTFTGCAGGEEKAAGSDTGSGQTVQPAPEPAPAIVNEDTVKNDTAGTKPVVPPNK